MLNSSIVVSRLRYPDGEPLGVSGLSCTMPNGTIGPGNVLPPAPPGTGLGELLSSVPMNVLTNWVRFKTAAISTSGAPPAPGTAAFGPGASSRPATLSSLSSMSGLAVVHAPKPRANAITALHGSTRTGHLSVGGRHGARTSIRACASRCRHLATAVV